MFERYTEHGRQAILYARHEAHRHGSPVIDTEHVLLGLLRADRTSLQSLPGRYDAVADIRGEIESRLARVENATDSVDLPLSADSSKALAFAEEAAVQLGHRSVDITHMLVGLVRVETSVAAQVLTARGLRADELLRRIGDSPIPLFYVKASPGAILTLSSFLSGLQSLKAGELLGFFAERAEFTDAKGKRWTYSEIRRQFEALFAPYAKKSATYYLEATLVDTRESFVSTVVWRSTAHTSEASPWLERMTVGMVPRKDDWEIASIQVAAVDPA
jgi:hypothetical protein